MYIISFFTRNKIAIWVIISLCIESAPGLSAPLAEDPSVSHQEEYDILTATDRQIQSLGCVVMSGAVGVTTVLFGSTGMAFLGLRGAATATTVAIPVLVTTLAAGCALGAQASLGIVWLHQNQKILLAKWKDLYPDVLSSLKEK